MINLSSLFIISIPYSRYHAENEPWSAIKIRQNYIRTNSHYGYDYYCNKALLLNTFEPPQTVNSCSPCKLYILSDCKINREFLRNSGYTITRSAEKADLVVLPKRIYDKNISDYKFLYSPSHNQWYLIDSDRMNSDWILKSLHCSENSVADLFLNKIKTMLIVPSDTTYIDTSNSTWFKSDIVAEFFKKDTSNMKFIYDTDLSSFLNTDNVLDIDTMQQIDAMLKSNSDTCSMGMKLMTTFNPQQNQLPLLALMQFNANKINYNSTKNSIAFKSLVNSLPEINIKAYNPLFNFTKYFKSCNDIKQKIIVHQYLKTQILDEINNVTNRYHDLCSNYDLTLSINVDGWLNESQSQD